MDFEELILPALIVGGGIYVLSQMANAAAEDGSVMGQTYSAAVMAIARFINIAEESGRVDPRTHNPGNLKNGDVGFGLWKGITIYPNDDAGWDALYYKIDNMLSGKSAVYSPNMTVAQFAAKYTATQQDAWAQNFSVAAGVSPDTTLNDVAALHG